MIRSFLFLATALSLGAQTPAPAPAVPLVKAPAAPAQPTGPVITLKAETQPLSALFKVGEKVTFNITVTQDGKPQPTGTVQCSFSKDGVEPRREETVTVKDGRATVTGTLDEPGFLLLRVTQPGQKEFALASAGFSPEKIKPSLPVPPDYDAFWEAQKAALAKVAIKSTLTPVESKVAGVDIFDVQVTSLGAPVSGYYGRPQNAKPKSYPAILFVHGAGVGGSSLGAANWSSREGGMLSLDINAHGLPNGKPKSFYDEQAAGPLRDYRFQGRANREENYFKGMFLRVIRALDFLTAQPEWDGKTLIVYGSSQGGFQAFAAAGLDSRVTFFCAGVPAGCDHTGSVVGRVNGWPKLVAHVEGKPVPEELQTARYFDNVNFATRARCKGAAITVGLIDTVCPPTGIYAAYNVLPISKTLHIMPLTGHKSSPEASQFMTDAALQHVREMRK